MARIQDGQVLNDEVRRRTEAMVAREEALLAERQARRYALQRRTTLVVGAGAAAGVSGGLLGVWLFAAAVAGRLRGAADDAARLGAGESPGAPDTSADELGALSRALARAATLLDARQAEVEHANRTLADAERFTSSIVENIPETLFVKDARDLRFVRFNRAAEELLGYRREELLGRTDREVFGDEAGERFNLRDREALAGTSAIEIPEEPVETRHRGCRTLHTKKITIRDEHGRPQYLLGISQDITEQKLAEHVEGNIANVRLMERLLARRPGVQLMHAGDGQSALAGLAAQRPELVLLDLHLPDMSGEEVLRRIWENPQTRGIPVAVLSADATSAQTRRLLAAGATTYMTKPFNVSRVLELVDRTLGAGDAS